MLGPSAGLILIDKKPQGFLHTSTIAFENAFFEWKKSQSAPS
jgi:hypothetical protein